MILILNIKILGIQLLNANLILININIHSPISYKYAIEKSSNLRQFCIWPATKTIVTTNRIQETKISSKTPVSSSISAGNINKDTEKNTKVKRKGSIGRRPNNIDPDIAHASNVSSLIGCIQQLSYVANAALETFGELSLLTNNIGERISKITLKSKKLFDELGSIESKTVSKLRNNHSKFINTPLTGDDDEAYINREIIIDRKKELPSVFTRESNPNRLRTLYQLCKTPPQYWKIEQYFDDKYDFLMSYSNPSIFFQEWMTVELKKQALLKKKRQKLKAIKSDYKKRREVFIQQRKIEERNIEQLKSESNDNNTDEDDQTNSEKDDLRSDEEDETSTIENQEKQSGIMALFKRKSENKSSGKSHKQVNFDNEDPSSEPGPNLLDEDTDKKQTIGLGKLFGPFRSENGKKQLQDDSSGPSNKADTIYDKINFIKSGETPGKKYRPTDKGKGKGKGKGKEHSSSPEKRNTQGKKSGQYIPRKNRPFSAQNLFPLVEEGREKSGLDTNAEQEISKMMEDLTVCQENIKSRTSQSTKFSSTMQEKSSKSSTSFKSSSKKVSSKNGKSRFESKRPLPPPPPPPIDQTEVSLLERIRNNNVNSDTLSQNRNKNEANKIGKINHNAAIAAILANRSKIAGSDSETESDVSFRFSDV